MPVLPPAIFIMGPTAAGKTDLALSLYDALPCEIISVDSALVYRGMDIGTAKPDAGLLARYPHRLIDILDPAEAYSAARFREDALAAMAEISAAGRIPLLVGGTMLYYRALEQGMAELPQASPQVRAQLDAEAARIGWSGMHERLQQIDPVSAARIHPNDPQRIQRALEVYELTGVSMTALHERGRQLSPFPYRVAKVVVCPQERSILHQRIEQRFQRMLAQGMVEEVRLLKLRGDLDLDTPSMRAVGYRQVWHYLEGDMGYDEMADRGVVATRQFAKRQLTWLRSERNGRWFDSESKNLLPEVLKYLEDALS